MKQARVKDILKAYKDGEIRGVKEYLTSNEIQVDPSTWSNKILTLITNNSEISASYEIELVLHKFNIE